MLLKRAVFAMALVFGLMVSSIATTVAAGVPASAPAPVAFQDDDDDDATVEAEEDIDTDDAADDADDASDDNDDADDEDDDRGQSSSGDTVTVVDERGDPILEITVNDVIEEWEDFSEFSSPDRGYLFVAFNVTVTNISDDEQEVTDFDFMIRDEFGFLYGTSFVSVEEDTESEEIGVFEGDDVDAGDSITGLIIFGVPDDVQLVDLFYAPYGRLITIATLS